MSIPRHHTEWLSLVPVSGPFLSLPVLLEAFPQGLDAHDAEHARLLRLAYEEWDEATGARDQGRGTSMASHHSSTSTHHSFIKFILTKTLEYDESLLAEGQSIPQTLQVEVPEHGELLKPSIALMSPPNPESRSPNPAPRLLIQTYPRSQNLTSYVAGSRWKASPDTRMTDLLHGTGVRLGLVTNGDHWMLVDAPKGETTGYASWYASLWREEKITLQAFRSLLSMTRLFGVAEDQTLEALLAKSASNQQEVTEQLGRQVLRAVEVLIQSLDKADQDHGRELLAGVNQSVLYESALNVMMRLVFLFCAEERELIPTKPFPVYEQNYSVSTISKQLREIADQHGEELLERRFDAWPRLLSAFRAVYGGLAHDDIYMPAYGGRLFDPDRFPFLEGRKPGTTWKSSGSGIRGPGSESISSPTPHPEPRAPDPGPRAPDPDPRFAEPLPVNNRTVLHLLEALQLLQVKVPGGGPSEARRVSFRALDIEQIGHVYEGLLDHTAKRATEPTLGLFGKKEPEVTLNQLQAQKEKGDKSFFEFLKKQTGGTRKWDKYLRVELDDRQQVRLRTACGNDEALFEQVLPFAGLLRDDTFGYPVVIPSGSVFVTSGTDRRSSGTHYTPRSLTEPIVQYTLEPLVYVGPAEGKPKSEWKLKSAAELLDLKICDMACGSGAFLVQAARYMSERLMEAWDDVEREARSGVRDSGDRIDGDQEFSGLGSLEGGDGFGGGVLPRDQDVSKGRDVRADESDTTSGGIDSGQHRRGSRPGTHEGVPESPEHRPGIADGSADASTLGTSGGDSSGTRSQPIDDAVRANQPNDLPPPPVPKKTNLTRTPNPAPRPPNLQITPEGHPATGSPQEQLIPSDPTERRTFAMRIVAQRCLYGVDINPLATEMAKLSLWLLTLAKDKPFEFLDHAIRCGDSLVGLHHLDQLKYFSLKPDQEDETKFFGPWLDGVDEAIELRLKLEDMPSNTVEDIEAQEALLKEADDKIARLRYAADLLVAAEFWGENVKDKMDRLDHAAIVSGQYVEHGLTEEFREKAEKERRGQKMFHWPLEFSEVVVKRGGFDAFVGNPPFMGGKRIRTFLGASYRNYLDHFWEFTSSNVDQCGYFHLRCSALLRNNGCYGLISTERILIGDSKTTCIDIIGSQHGTFFSVIEKKQWPGDASVTISVLWFKKSNNTNSISESPVSFDLRALKANSKKCFVGCAIQGMGFVLDESDEERFSSDERDAVVRAFLIAQDLNGSVTCSAKRKIIFFAGMELHEAERFPTALEFVKQRVKPYRDTVNRKAHRERWWRFGDWRPGLYSEATKLEKVMVVGLTSKHLCFALVPSRMVFDQTVVVVTSDDMGLFAILSSTIHHAWALEFGASLGGTPRYNPSRCFEPYPFPALNPLQDIGSQYLATRQIVMTSHHEGLTRIYNRLHHPSDASVDIKNFRDLHAEMDRAVAAAYGWEDLALGHDFHETKHGLRFTISESARGEVLHRLLKLNHERYAEEVKQGLHDKKKGRAARSEGRGGKKKGAKKSPKGQGPSLFDMGGE